MPPGPRLPLADAVEALRRQTDATVHGEVGHLVVSDVVLDSRDARDGAVFCCVVGRTDDGHLYAADAVASGAVAVLTQRPLDLAVPQIQVSDVRRAMGPLAAIVHDRPSDSLEVLGVTGTNGKTTVTHMLKAILDADERPTGVVGTLSGVRTTPEAPDLQRALAVLRDTGHRCAAIEVSSHALDQHRVDATRFRVGVFTNLSRDHLDYHGTMEAYFQAKARLFEPALCERAVVNTDDPHGRLLLDAAQIPTVGYSLDDVSELELGAAGSRFRWRGQAIELRIGGRFNVSNAVAAATAAAELGVAPAVVAAGLTAVPQIDGRFQVVELDAPYTVVVDFAHTPDGLSRLLESGREVVGGHRIHLVFGCGGERDRTKRPAMGEVADRLADLVYVTSDNPRGEDPADIIQEVLRGVNRTEGVVVETDRRAAIAAALSAAVDGDLVIVAGKGHETVQEIGGQRHPFDDRVVVQEEHDALGRRRA